MIEDKEQKKVALVTGGAGNIGKAICARLVDRGFSVKSIDLNHEAETASKNIDPVRLDISSQSEVVKFFDSLSRVDVLVNNAGVGVFTPTEERTEAEFRKVFEVNMLGTFLMCQQAVRRMKERQTGRIINIGSIYGVKSSDPRIYGDSGRNNSEVYSMTKAAVIQLTRYLAAHYAQVGLQINCISPGGVFAGQDNFFVENYKNKTPAGRMGSTSDTARLVELLAVDCPDYVNGQNIAVDGGFLSW